jgi:hypothetical protein
MGILVSEVHLSEITDRESVPSSAVVRRAPVASVAAPKEFSAFKITSIVLSVLFLSILLLNLMGFSLSDVFYTHNIFSAPAIRPDETQTTSDPEQGGLNRDSVVQISELQTEVQDSIAKYYRENKTDLADRFVDDVQLVHSVENTYKGFATVTLFPKDARLDEIHDNVPLEVTVSGGKLIWQMGK